MPSSILAMKHALLLALIVAPACASATAAPGAPPTPPAPAAVAAAPEAPSAPSAAAPVVEPRASGKPEIRYYEISDA
jgi:hypothetical protein